MESFLWELLKFASNAKGNFQLLYHRNHDHDHNHNHYEVNLIAENAAGQLNGIEIEIEIEIEIKVATSVNAI